MYLRYVRKMFSTIFPSWNFRFHTSPLFTLSPSLSINLAISTMSMLFIYSALVSNTIGIIYVCSKNENMRFAYLDFWGNRNHYDTTIDNIADPSGENVRLYQTVRLRDDTKTFKLATRHGNITDFFLYEKLFGRSGK